VKVILRGVTPADKDWLDTVLSSGGVEDFVSPEITAEVLTTLPGFIAHVEGDRLGVISYKTDPRNYEIVLLFSSRPGLGIGRALVNSVLMEANDAKRERVTVIARNPNGKGVTFFKGLGFSVCSVRPESIEDPSPGIGNRVADIVPTAATGDQIELSFTLRR
jgi:hypothetical protein